MLQAAAPLIWRDPPPDLAPHVMGFAMRDERPRPEVVRLLPDVRSAIQAMAAAPYWINGRGGDGGWRRLPAVTLWGPTYAWAFGFPAGHVRAFGAVLTAEGLARLVARPAWQVADRVLPLAEVNALLAAALTPRPDDDLAAWLDRALPALRSAFAGAPHHDPLWGALPILATAEAGAVGAAAAESGLSERQFRRLFHARYGATPKRYQRALRVDRMLRQLHPRPWETDPYLQHPIAFADQPHAIREFRALTGLTPTQYLRAKAQGDATLRSVTAPGVAPPEEAWPRPSRSS